ncbi:MAG: hypothetical protein K2H73_07360, partial [Treponemataceae bacterium]|nr:hypothetical protein [Treponemataceae bacterium]
PKERAVLSFVLAKKGAHAHKPPAESSGEQPKKRLALRVTSDFIRLPELHKSGYYACSELGLVLAVDKTHVHPQNGELLSVAYPADTGARDKKSGAILLEI